MEFQYEHASDNMTVFEWQPISNGVNVSWEIQDISPINLQAVAK